MRYDFVFRMNCVELYKNGQWSNTPEGMNQKDFRKRIARWAKLADFIPQMQPLALYKLHINDL